MHGHLFTSLGPFPQIPPQVRPGGAGEECRVLPTLYQCVRSLLSLVPHFTCRGWGSAGLPLPLLCFPTTAMDLYCFSAFPMFPLSHVYFSSLLLHPINLSLFPSHLPILKGLSGEERDSPASPHFIYQIRPGVRFYLRKGE